ncbi:MAG: DoxX family membrane protein [Myxococcales bacterium]|nr:DoxX family membrane protein [Myxococcales bacterium]MCB9700615.1 DoxX family membrane protein [Myxococcales bacterium]
MASARLERGVVVGARLLVAAVFVAAAVPKILDPAGFAAAIRNYQAFPYWSWNGLAVGVPMLEVVGALALLSGWKRQAGALLLGGLTLAFVALITSVIVRGIDIGCGCFGQSEAAESVGWPLLVRDLGLLAAIVVAAREPGPLRAARVR